MYVIWADYRSNTNPDCSWALRRARITPCDNDVFYAFSTDGGATWSATRDVTPRSRFGETAQWQPWSEVTTDGSRLWVGFYDRQYGNCETTGCNDITAAQIRNPSSNHPNYGYTRVTTGSMPNLAPANNPIEAGFIGDYMWVATTARGGRTSCGRTHVRGRGRRSRGGHLLRQGPTAVRPEAGRFAANPRKPMRT